MDDSTIEDVIKKENALFSLLKEGKIEEACNIHDKDNPTYRNIEHGKVRTHSEMESALNANKTKGIIGYDYEISSRTFKIIDPKNVLETISATYTPVTVFAEKEVPQPLIISFLWTNNGMDWKLAYLHTAYNSAKQFSLKSAKVFLSIYLYILMLILCSLPVVLYTLAATKICSFIADHDLIKTLGYLASSGGIGGVVFCMRDLYQKSDLDTEPLNVPWFILRPIMSAAVGVFVYFFIIGGLFSISSKGDVNYNKGIMFYCAVSFLAGYSFTKFAGKLNDTSSSLFGKVENTDSSKEAKSKKVGY